MQIIFLTLSSKELLRETKHIQNSKIALSPIIDLTFAGVVELGTQSVYLRTQD